MSEAALLAVVERPPRGFRRYGEYKDSGVEWLGEIPRHWDVSKTKVVARLRSGHTPSRQHPEYWEDCTIPWFGLTDVWQIREGQREYVTETAEKISELGLRNSAARLLPKGTVLLSRTASVGFSAIMGVDMTTTQDFVNWVCGLRLKPEYLLYVFRAMRQEFRRLTMGSTHQTIYMPDVGRFSTALPPLEEQDRIVAFIRRETTRIDALVAKKERLIKLLEEKRRAVIDDVLLRGVGRSMTSEDSGVGFLGRIPAHWVVTRLKWLCLGQAQGVQMGPFGSLLRDVRHENTGFKLYGQENTISGDFSQGTRWLTQAQFEELERYRIRPDDIVLTRKGSIGNARLVPTGVQAGVGDSDTIRLRVNREKIDSQFLVLLLHQASYIRGQIESSRRGAVLSGLNTATVADLVIAVPPLSEQSRIVSVAVRQTTVLDALIARIRTAISHLHELRTALISAAVTGKIDVREEVAA